MKKVGIVGLGYVGNAMREFFLKPGSSWNSYYDIAVYDKKYSNIMEKSKINEADVAIICVPTPSTPDGRCDTSIVEEVIDWVQAPLIIIKSTVEPGTTDRLKAKTGKRIVFSPEYCGESSYWSPYKFHTDVKETPFFTFGGDKKDTSKCVSLYLPVTGPTKVYKQTTALEAEMAKYIENCFYATKIAFCYDMATLCEKVGADWNEVRELWLLDPRINPMHTAVFSENDQPYSGKCLPKDIAALVAYGKEKGYKPEILSAVIEANQKIGDYRAERNK